MRSRIAAANRRALFSLFGILVCGTLVALQPLPLPPRLTTTRETPRTFGVDSYNVTTVSAVGFYPSLGSYFYGTSGDLGRYGQDQTVENFYAQIDLPPGAIIDYIGLNSSSPAPAALGVEIDARRFDGLVTHIINFDSTQHGMDTEFNTTPVGYLYQGGALLLHVQQGAFDLPPVFGWVEVWWKRSVTPPPDFPDFSDVSFSSPYFQYVHALYASGITGGCGDGNYCPNAPLTRGQMAVFLSKALGLHWPAN